MRWRQALSPRQMLTSVLSLNVATHGIYCNPASRMLSLRYVSFKLPRISYPCICFIHWEVDWYFQLVLQLLTIISHSVLRARNPKFAQHGWTTTRECWPRCRCKCIGCLILALLRPGQRPHGCTFEGLCSLSPNNTLSIKRPLRQSRSALPDL